MIKSVKKREECSIVPQGISYSETDLAFYIYFRRGDVITSRRIGKPDIDWPLSEIKCQTK